jgi:hypothetical protein
MEREPLMKLEKTEATKLIKNHIEELRKTAEELGGVFITGIDGAVAVIGAQDFKKKILFRTAFITRDENKLLDAQVEMQDLLEEEGIEAISEHDFNLAIDPH